MENLKADNQEWFKDYLRGVLESEKSYFEKADYIAYSINQIQNKIDYISNEIKELQTIKKNLTNVKEIALEITATVLAEYGIDKLEGATISSITITPESSKSKDVVTIKDDNAVMGLGFVSFSVDMEAVEKAITSKEGLDELKEFIEVNTFKTIIPAKIKINNKRTSANTEINVDEILVIEEAA
jgi:peptidyl-tRNA hydrolase